RRHAAPPAPDTPPHLRRPRPWHHPGWARGCGKGVTGHRSWAVTGGPHQLGHTGRRARYPGLSGLSGVTTEPVPEPTTVGYSAGTPAARGKPGGGLRDGAGVPVCPDSAESRAEARAGPSAARPE